MSRTLPIKDNADNSGRVQGQTAGLLRFKEPEHTPYVGHGAGGAIQYSGALAQGLLFRPFCGQRRGGPGSSVKGLFTRLVRREE